MGCSGVQKDRWCPETESNRRHEDFQSSALPTELSGRNKDETMDLQKEARIKPPHLCIVNSIAVNYFEVGKYPSA